MIKVQGPRDQDSYYKVNDTNIYVEFHINNQPIIAYKCSEEPNYVELWREQMAAVYPEVTHLMGKAIEPFSPPF